jgi:hypothetical protein
MVESEVHRSMKSLVREDLEHDRYVVIEEPGFLPGSRVSWSSYRPDLLGYRANGGTEEVVLVECETHPNMRRLWAKNFSSVWFQPYLFRQGSVRRILVVPRGRLRSVDMSIRKGWEVWVVGPHTTMAKFPAIP